MADITREMEEFKAANRTFGGEWKVEMKGVIVIDQQQPSSPIPSPPRHPRPNHLPTTATYHKAFSNKYKSCNYNYNATWTNRNAEAKRQRRVMKYKQYGVEAKLKSSFMSGYRWMKNKYCEIVRGF